MREFSSLARYRDELITDGVYAAVAAKAIFQHSTG